MKYKITALFVTLGYILFNSFIIFTSLMWLKSFSPVERYNIYRFIFLLIYIFLMLTPIISFIARKTALEIYLIKIGNVFLGLFAIISMFVLLGHGVYFLFTRHITYGYYITGLACFLSTIGVYIHSVINSSKMVQKRYDIEINKNTRLKIALISDLHIGYNNGYKDLIKIKKIINRNKVDVILLAGDIFDNDIKYLEEKDKIKNAFLKMHSKYGIFGVYGNHDVKEKLLLGFSFTEIKDLVRDSKVDEFLEECNITMLNDEYILVDNKFYLVGRFDDSKTGILNKERQEYKMLTDGIDTKYPVIVIEHEPDDYEFIKENADLVVSGHTHNGQIFPFNIALKLVMQNSYGYKKFDNLNTITTSGAGIWGPHIRLGTKNEVVIINMKG